jgi:hypothetical protein
MRIEPEKTVDNTPELKAKSQAKIDRWTHKAALGFVLFIVLFFFFKMLLP